MYRLDLREYMTFVLGLTRINKKHLARIITRGRKPTSLSKTYVASLLVLSVCLPCKSHAAKSAPVPNLSDPRPPPTKLPEFTPAQEAARKSIDIAQPPPIVIRPPNQSDEFFYHFRKSLTVRSGIVYLSKPEESSDDGSLGDSGNISSDGKQLLSILGVEYMFPDADLRSWESGADLISDGSGVLHIARRFELSRSRFRPFYKLGVGVRVIPSEQLVTFIRLSNYQLRAAFGFEHSVGARQSLRVDFEGLVATTQLQAGCTIGYVWAW